MTRFAIALIATLSTLGAAHAGPFDNQRDLAEGAVATGQTFGSSAMIASRGYFVPADRAMVGNTVTVSVATAQRAPQTDFGPDLR